MEGRCFVSLDEFLSFVKGPDEMDEAAEERLRLKEEKRRVLTPQELTLCYQFLGTIRLPVIFISDMP